jgi:hypothetical protein
MVRPVPTSSRQAGKDGGERVIEHESWELHTESAGDDEQDIVRPAAVDAATALGQNS